MQITGPAPSAPRRSAPNPEHDDTTLSDDAELLTLVGKYILLSGADETPANVLNDLAWDIARTPVFTMAEARAKLDVMFAHDEAAGLSDLHDDFVRCAMKSISEFIMRETPLWSR